MGLILYCGIRHERNVEKARDYLDGDTIEFLERALKHPDLVKPYGRILYGIPPVIWNGMAGKSIWWAA